MDTIRIALVDDQKLFLQSLASLIASVPNFELVFTADDGNDCLQQLNRLQNNFPDIILMDMEMPGMDGVELNSCIHNSFPTIKTIVLSIHARERLIARMVEAGASGYLFKNCDKEELISAIETVHKRDFYINAQVLKAIQSSSNKKAATTTNINKIPIELSAREKEVLLLICQEKSSAEIASELFISVRTAEGHRNNLLTKIGCRNMAGLVLFAVKHGIYELVY